MFKRILLALAICLMLAAPAFPSANTTVPANGLLVNETGSSGVCVAVTTASAVTVAHGDPNATSLALYADQAMNCYPGTIADGAPATTPTTGAVGTGAGMPIPSGVWVTISPARTLVIGQSLGATALDLGPPGARYDCIAQSSNGHVCTVRTY